MMRKGEILLAEDNAGGLVASIYAEQRGILGYLGMLAVDPHLSSAPNCRPSTGALASSKPESKSSSLRVR